MRDVTCNVPFRMKALAAAVAATPLALLAAPASAGTSVIPPTNAAALRPVGQAVPTITLSGSTALRNFTIAPGSTFLTPGTSLTLGPVGQEITYSAAAGVTTNYQLASSNFALPDTVSGPSQNHSAERVEWHEQGSVEGILELADSQINDGILANSTYQPTLGNAVYVNRSRFGGVNNGGSIPQPGSPVTQNGFTLAFQGDGPRDPQALGRVQMAISDVNAAQAFSRPGTAAFNRAPGQAGYGQGNPALPAGPLGTAGARQSFNDDSVLNFTPGTIDPGTGAAYAAGNPGATGGINNLNNTAVAQTATAFVANPGTGLEHVNRTDAQFLQAAGRLANGADFNVVTRDTGSGTRNVAANNVGLDPTFAVGENDSGNGNVANPIPQTKVGPDIQFSNKTSGGGQLRPTVQNSRMAIGHLGLSDLIGSDSNASPAPLRALGYRDDANDVSDGSNGANFRNYNIANGQVAVRTGDRPTGEFVAPSAATITEGSYVIYQNETYVTVKDPNNYNGNVIKGDNSGNDVRDYRDNIVNAALSVPFPTPTSVANPADTLLNNRFLVNSLMGVKKDRDGIDQSVVNPGFNAAARDQFLSSAQANNFNPADPASVTTGSSSRYAAANAPEPIPITSNNYLFGDFRQTDGGKGTRDFSDLAVAQRAQAALGANGSLFTGGNSAPVAGAPAELGFTPTKGDLIVLGDFDSNGTFDGQDLYRMARGTALADSSTSTTLSGNFADAVRTGVLRKNAALDQLNAASTPLQRMQASANVMADPTGTNAFNKLDVNRDGVVNLADAKVVDKFVGTDYRSLTDQLSATVDAAGSTGAGPQRAISLVDVELTDNGAITHVAPSGGTSDFKVLSQSLIASGRLSRGDVNLSGGRATNADLITTVNSFGKNPGANKWTTGDVANYDGAVTNSDLITVVNDFTPPAGQAPGAASARFDRAVPVAGDGTPDVLYDPATGDLTLVPDAKLIGYDFLTDPAVTGGFRHPGTAEVPFQTPFITRTAGEIGWQDISGGSFTDPFTITGILPLGLDQAGLMAFFGDSAIYSAGFGDGGQFNLAVVNAVPEPTGLSLLAFAGLATLRRRRARLA